MFVVALKGHSGGLFFGSQLRITKVGDSRD